MRIYLDSNAAAPLRPEARAAVVAALELTGNPSSPHAEGQRARDLVDEARADVAALVAVAPREVTFTASATEALNLGVTGLGRARLRGGARRLVISSVEHAAVREPAEALVREGLELAEVRVDGAGRLDLERLGSLLGSDVALVALIHVNNETGVVSDVAGARRLCRAAGVPLLVDAAQSAGKLALDWEALGADVLALSSVKLGGPLGAGALAVRRGLRLEPLLLGGPHERGLRAGSEALPALAGFGAAARAARTAVACEAERVLSLRLRLEAGLAAFAREHRIVGVEAERAPGTISVCFPGADAEALVVQLDLAGVASSTGAACASGAALPSRVLMAMGASEAEARGTLRLSLSHATTEPEVDAALELLAAALAAQQREGVWLEAGAAP